MVYAILFIALIAICIAMAPKPPEQKPASLSDFKVPTAEPGRPIGVVFGTYVIESPNIVWYGDLTNTPVQGGGK